MAKNGDIIDGKKVVHKIEDNMNPQDVLCTTYQMRNIFQQFGSGFFSNLDVMNYIQHHKAAKMAKAGMNVLDVCCGRSMILPLLRYYSKTIKSYTGVDISETNINEAKRGCTCRKWDVKEEELESYYPFETNWVLSNVDSMSQHLTPNSMDLIVYTSAIEHMHKDVGYQSLKECKKLLSSDGLMFLSCPNTPGNGYETQYAAHVYEWGYDELKTALHELDFEIVQEVGLVLQGKDVEPLIASQPKEVQDFCNKLKNYLPSEWLTSILAIPFPETAKEVLFVVRHKKKRLF